MPSASLVPVEDNSILWINAGVAALKKYFDGSETPPSPRMTNSQKAIRTGDIENVGITTRHHTFFEMLGNFSIGDYFKKEAIEFAWELLTSEEYFGIDKSLLYITVFKEDEEALTYWKEIGIPDDRIFKMDRDTNFWDLGSGPCGPSSEIFFDKGPEFDSRSAKELIEPDLENDRYIEIWNIVFSEFNNDGQGNYTKLPQQNIDTGAGLERITSAFQNKPSNFETDLFEEIIKTIDSKTKYNYLWEYIPKKLEQEDHKQFLINSWYKKIADYIRSVSFAISDGAIPDNSGRGYIIRMLLRKAVINRNKLEITDKFLHELVEPLVNTMGEYYPLLKEKKQLIIDIIKKEEEQFDKTLSQAVERMNKEIESNGLDEEKAYKLHETFGLPLDLLRDIAETREDINLDWDRIDEIDKEFKLKSKGNKEVEAMKIQDDKFRGLGETEFIGYEELECTTNVKHIDGEYVVFDKTPFYATSGGQESDYGLANSKQVVGVEKNAEKTFIHHIPGHEFEVGQEVQLKVDEKRRFGLTRHHTSHHLIAHAFDHVVGEVMPQSSFKAEENYIRFGFTTQQDINEDIVNKAQEFANQWIKEEREITIEEVSLEEAKNRGALFLQGAKYGDEVRIVTIKDLVIDMCGGTHLSNTKDVEEVLITNYEKKGSGNWSFDLVAGKENVAKEVININNSVKEDIVKPLINKVENIKNKLNELNINMELDFNQRIENLDDTSSSFKKSALDLSQEIGKEISKINNTLVSEMERIIEDKNEEIIIIESSLLNIQEITRPMLNKIDHLDTKLAIAIINNEEKITFGFILSSDCVNEGNVNRIKELAEKYELRGNGKKQQYIFGGRKFDTTQILEEIKGWEF